MKTKQIRLEKLQLLLNCIITDIAPEVVLTVKDVKDILKKVK